MEEKALMQEGSKALTTPHFETEDISRLHQAARQYRSMRKSFRDREGDMQEQLITELKGAGTRIKKRSWRTLGRTQEYQYLGPGYSALSEQVGKILQGIFPQELLQDLNALVGDSYSSTPDSAVGKTIASLSRLESETNNFLKYFFLTPVNYAEWEKTVRETIPVTESWWFLLGGSTTVRPFEKTYDETGFSRAESIQMLRAPLTDEHVQFFMHRLVLAAQQLQADLKYCTRSFQVPALGDEKKTPAGELFPIEVSILNHGLEGVINSPISHKGAYAILFNTAFQRVKPEVHAAIQDISSSARDLLGLRSPNNHDMEGIYKKAGFTLSFKGYQNPQEAMKRKS